MAQHFQYINKLKGKVAASSLKMEEAADRNLVLEMAIKCADLNNPTKETNLCTIWAYRVMQEFFSQGDLERRMGIPVSTFMDREDTNIPRWYVHAAAPSHNSQIGFIDVLVTPLFDAWSNCIQTEFSKTCMENIRINREYWESLLSQPDAVPVFKEVDESDHPELKRLNDPLFPADHLTSSAESSASTGSSPLRGRTRQNSHGHRLSGHAALSLSNPNILGFRVGGRPGGGPQSPSITGMVAPDYLAANRHSLDYHPNRQNSLNNSYPARAVMRPGSSSYHTSSSGNIMGSGSSLAASPLSGSGGKLPDLPGKGKSQTLARSFSALGSSSKASSLDVTTAASSDSEEMLTSRKF